MKISTGDFETDPFSVERALAGRGVEPFCVGYYDGADFLYWWGNDCPAKFAAYLRSKEEAEICYFHNGGRFDFIFLMPYIDGELRIVNGRLLSAKIGNVELRDSWGIIPEPLKQASDGNKLDIDYTVMERDKRDNHRDDIVKYLRVDCVELWKLCAAFVEEFGARMTIGGTAMRELKNRHEFAQASPAFDRDVRPYYMGGRCQAMGAGIFHGTWRVYDINSAYAFAMREIQHPIGSTFNWNNRITSRTAFARVRAINRGALGMHTPEGLRFDVEKGEFNATIHEIKAGEETGRLKVLRVIQALDFQEWGTFEDFIDTFTSKKIAAEKRDDKIHRDFYKRVCNSAYGRFAIDGAKHLDCTLTGAADPAPLPQPSMTCMRGECCGECWRVFETGPGYIIWYRPAQRQQYDNIATGASITGATRAILLRALDKADMPMYCDTDSIICRSLGVDVDPLALGKWKLEDLPKKSGMTEFDELAIAGKKLYACFRNGEPVKHACKGVRITPDEIRQIARGAEITHRNIAPTMTLGGSVTYITRRVRRTAMAQKF